MKHYLRFSVFAGMLFLLLLGHILPVQAKKNKQKTYIIVLDPGHGDYGTGASGSLNGTKQREEEKNLKIGLFLKEELEKYKHVKVYLTRDDEYDVDLEERTQIALDYKADLMVSLHNNASGPFADYDHGSTVLVARGQYKEELAEKGQELGASILYELSQLGLEDQGLLMRDSTNGGTYKNDAVTDYYAIIRNGIQNDLLSVLIEHAFIDDEEDCEKFLKGEKELRSLAQADARGIARYLNLSMKKEEKEKGEKDYEELIDYKQKILYVKDDEKKHNKTYEKIYFAKKGEEPQEAETSELPEEKREKSAGNSVIIQKAIQSSCKNIKTAMEEAIR